MEFPSLFVVSRIRFRENRPQTSFHFLSPGQFGRCLLHRPHLGPTSALQIALVARFSQRQSEVVNCINCICLFPPSWPTLGIYPRDATVLHGSLANLHHYATSTARAQANGTSSRSHDPMQISQICWPVPRILILVRPFYLAMCSWSYASSYPSRVLKYRPSSPPL